MTDTEIINRLEKYKLDISYSAGFQGPLGIQGGWYGMDGTSPVPPGGCYFSTWREAAIEAIEFYEGESDATR